jgi:hypothetical protein
MPANRDSLLAGRNHHALTESDIRRAVNTFLGFDPKSPVRFVDGDRTRFRVAQEEQEEIVEIIFGRDLYPGAGVVDPNSSLSMAAAAAHEITHWQRWVNKTEIAQEDMFEIDEAMTSLEAAMRFHAKLSEHDVRQLIADAIQRLQIFAQKIAAAQQDQSSP